MLDIIYYFLSFILVTTILVFVHEFGHYIVAKIFKVKIEAFSIGFGKEIYGFTDKSGTRWKFCNIPLGGYVKMLGDRNESSMPKSEDFFNDIKEDEKQNYFIFKNIYQKFLIVLAGPLSNFLFAILLMAILFKIDGKIMVEPVVTNILPNSVAEKYLKKGDKILKIDNEKITDFLQIKQKLFEYKEGEILFQIKRSEEIINLKLTPKIKEISIDGSSFKVGFLGVEANKIITKKLNLPDSIIAATKQTYNLSVQIFSFIKKLIIGERSVEELSGPVKIAKYSGDSIKHGFRSFFWLMVVISINLAVINLLPVPTLDGGHLLFYLIEIITLRKVPQYYQNILYRVGFSLLLTFMLLSIYVDLKSLFLI